MRWYLIYTLMDRWFDIQMGVYDKFLFKSFFEGFSNNEDDFIANQMARFLYDYGYRSNKLMNHIKTEMYPEFRNIQKI